MWTKSPTERTVVGVKPHLQDAVLAPHMDTRVFRCVAFEPAHHDVPLGSVLAQGTVNRYTRAAVPLYSAVFSLADASAVMRLNAFHNSV